MRNRTHNSRNPAFSYHTCSSEREESTESTEQKSFAMCIRVELFVLVHNDGDGQVNDGQKWVELQSDAFFLLLDRIMKMSTALP